MNNKFENEKSQRKNPKGPLWHDRTLHKNTGLNLCLSIYIKSLVFVFVQSVYVVFLLNKAIPIPLSGHMGSRKTYNQCKDL